MKSGSMLRTVTLGIGCLLFVLPFFVMLCTSLKPAGELAANHMLSLPRAPDLHAWRQAWSYACIGTACKGLSIWFANTLSIAIPSLVLSLSLGAVTGYALLTARTTTGTVLVGLLTFGLFIPPQVTLYPTIILLRHMGLFATTTGLVFVHVMWGLPFVTLLFLRFFQSLPPEIFRMARIDGASFPVVFARLLLPASLPAVGTAAILQFTFIWNDYLLGLTFGSSSKLPIMVGLYALATPQYGHNDYDVSMAAAMITSAPTLMLYLCSWKLLARGINGVTAKG